MENNRLQICSLCRGVVKKFEGVSYVKCLSCFDPLEERRPWIIFCEECNDKVLRVNEDTKCESMDVDRKEKITD